MSEFEINRKMADVYRKSHPPSTRIELLHMNDPFAPVEDGTRGTIVHIDDQAQIHMKWDNGRTLALVPGHDSFRKLTKEECEQEKTAKTNIVL